MDLFTQEAADRLGRDDVLSQINALMDWGRPRCIRLATLIDRGHRELPVQADFSGAVVETDRSESIQVCLREIDGLDEVRLWAQGRPRET